MGGGEGEGEWRGRGVGGWLTDSKKMTTSTEHNYT